MTDELTEDSFPPLEPDPFGDRSRDGMQSEIDRLRAALAQRTADLATAKAERDEARREVFKALKELFTTAGLRHELVRRGWWDWYREVRP